MKKIEDYLHLYLGCEVKCIESNQDLLRVYALSTGSIITMTPHKYFTVLMNKNSFKPILCPLSSMTGEEMTELLLVLFYHKDPDYKINADELDIEMFYNDGGNMVGANVAVGADISCRCYEGRIAIMRDGSIHSIDEDSVPEHIYNLPEGIRYLLSKHFDLFGLIDAGLALDATNI